MTRICTFLFFLLAVSLQAQVFDLNLPTGPGNAVEIIEVANNQYVTVGHSYGKAYAYKVNRMGQPIKVKHFKNIIGGTRSAFTDIVFANGSLYMSGYCEDCVAGDPGRKIVIVKTDTEFKTLRLLKLDSPTPSTIDSPFGWSKMAVDGNNIMVMSQLEQLADAVGGTNSQDTFTNFALTRLDQDLNIQYHQRYDYSQYDNVGDLQVYNGMVYAMAWDPNYSATQPLFGIGNEETALHVIDPATGAINNTFLYPGVGLSLTNDPSSSDLLIGGARTVSLQTGPQASVMRINSTTGSVIDFNTFGSNNRVDAILDLKALSNGNFIAATMVNNPYPSLNQILAGNIMSFSQLVQPREARVYRIRGNNLNTIGGGFLMPNLTPNNNIMVSSVLPLSTDGVNFITTGYRGKTAYFHSRLPIPGCRPTGDLQEAVVAKMRNDDASGLEAVAVSVFPNPASAIEGVFMSFEGNMTDRSRVMVYDAMGRLAGQTIVEQQGRYRIIENGQSGIYNILVIDAQNNVQNYRVVVE